MTPSWTSTVAPVAGLFITTAIAQAPTTVISLPMPMVSGPMTIYASIIYAEEKSTKIEFACPASQTRRCAVDKNRLDEYIVGPATRSIHYTMEDSFDPPGAGGPPFEEV